MNGLTPICPYCTKFSKLVTGNEVYPHRKDLHSLTFYKCSACKAFVGTHKGTTKPLGRLANAELRKAKMSAHKQFDQLWRDKYMSRQSAYKWLTSALNIDAQDCHIGMFDVEQCEDVAMLSMCKLEEIVDELWTTEK